MNTLIRILISLVVLASSGCRGKHDTPETTVGAATGSSQCKSCHPDFYKKWATSYHGLAMQPFTSEFAKRMLLKQEVPIKIGETSYRAILGETGSYVEERTPKEYRKLPMQQVLGGKNVYYFLTPLERGRLQVLPLAYDIQKKVWYDMAASGVRMHAEGPADQPLPWTDPAFTFNTSCYGCHVSQLKTNYDLGSDSYRSTWREPGIDCETCHGDGGEHVALFQNGKSSKVDDPKILRVTKFTVQQRNEMCAPCHAKMSPISPAYQATQRFFDHYDLVTLEDPDYYPDGRDLGENYTYTSWLMSPCVRGGKLDCIHCHTSSGRYRFASENANGACMPCHQEKVAKVEAHSHHKAGGPGGRCIDCHMPKTRFANMNRSDHSMLPPTPAATLRFKSPNACNLCHQDQTAAWADTQVRKWHKQDYQKTVLERATLIDAARKRDWTRLPAILAYIQSPGADPVFKASLVRLLQGCDDPKKWPPLIQALKNPDPLVRAAAATSLAGDATPESRAALARACGDEFRLVRIRAAASLASVPIESLPAELQDVVKRASEELVAAYGARPDDFANHTNLANFYLERNQLEQSIRSFETAIRLRPDSVGTLVNASMAYSRAGRNADAERVLKQALGLDPNNAAANFNLGLLQAEMGSPRDAEVSLRKALASEPTLAPAAYNLCVLLALDRMSEALGFCNQAVKNAPHEEKYAHSLAFYLHQDHKTTEAIRTLEAFTSRYPANVDSRLFLADLYVEAGQARKALSLYRTVLSDPALSTTQRRYALARITSTQEMRALQRR